MTWKETRLGDGTAGGATKLFFKKKVGSLFGATSPEGCIYSGGITDQRHGAMGGESGFQSDLRMFPETKQSI